MSNFPSIGKDSCKILPSDCCSFGRVCEADVLYCPRYENHLKNNKLPLQSFTPNAHGRGFSGFALLDLLSVRNLRQTSGGSL